MEYVILGMVLAIAVGFIIYQNRKAKQTDIEDVPVPTPTPEEPTVEPTPEPAPAPTPRRRPVRGSIASPRIDKHED